MIMVSVEGGWKSKIGEVRFWVCGLAITPADFLRVRSVTNFPKKKKKRRELLGWTP